jgi:hypothetical protein
VGIDVEIYFEADGEPSELWHTDRFSMQEADDYERKFGPTHKLSTHARYYGPHYERGCWPEICGVLLSLFASQNVKRVWYFGDCSDLDTQEPTTLDDVFAICRHYAAHAHRPYNDPDYRKSMSN